VLVCQPPSGCHPTGEICREDVDCCGSATRPDGDSAGIECSKGADAAVGRCNAGNACTPAGGICRLQEIECSANANCCSGNVLQNATCKQDNLGIPRCLAAEVDCTDPDSYSGKACATSADCCNLPCVPNPDGDPAFVCGKGCVNADGACTTSADCCSGLPCNVMPGSSSGVCGDVPGSGTGGTGGTSGEAGAAGAESGGTSGNGGTGGSGGSGGTGGTGGTGSCALYGQGCDTTADCCNGVPCTRGYCIVDVR